jgi:hypothetical protein
MKLHSNQTTLQKSTWKGVILALLLLGAVLALSGCAEPPAISAVEPTPTTFEPEPTDIPAPPPGPTPAALDFPLPPPATVGMEEEAVDDQACIDCHTDEDILKALAEPEGESEETLSEGEG